MICSHTGGTAEAGIKLIQRLGGEIRGPGAFIIEPLAKNLAGVSAGSSHGDGSQRRFAHSDGAERPCLKVYAGAGTRAGFMIPFGSNAA